LVRRANDIDFIVTDNEKEALLLENTLIKKHRPRYNLDLRDDKSYISIKISAFHPFPGISLTRRIKKDGSIYFGPYTSSAAAREAVELIVRYFCIRSCTETEFANRVRPCLEYDISRCSAPCVDRVTRENYAAAVEEAKMFLSGKNKELIRVLRDKMKSASDALRYEDAKRFRDAIQMLKGVVEKQGVVRHGGGDRDAIGIANFAGHKAICVLKVRSGTLIDKSVSFLSDDAAGDEGKLIEEFVLQRYRESAEIPPVVAVSHRPDGIGAIAEVLTDRKGVKVLVSVPLRGEIKRLVDLAITNSSEFLFQRAKKPDARQILET